MRIEVGPFQLSPYRRDDGAALLLHLADGRVGNTIPTLPEPYTSGDAEAFLAARLPDSKLPHPAALAIRDPGGSLCGGVALDIAPEGDAGDLGYWITSGLWGQGLMTAVVPAYLTYARAHLAPISITAHALTRNARSLRLLRRNGFTSLGVRTGVATTRAGTQDAEFFLLELEPEAAREPR